MNQEKIGIFIKRKRIERGLTQEQLANNIGVSPKTVSRWERGLNVPDTSILQSLSVELQVTTTELMLGEEENKLKMNHEDYSNLGIYYSQNKINQNLKKLKKFVLAALMIALILLIDVSYGYFSASLSWKIHEKMIFPRGVIFSLLFDHTIINTEGIILTNMFYIFIFVLISNIFLILIYVGLILYQNKNHRQ